MNYSKNQLIALVILRVFIGWHFLYEGIVKVINPNWTAAEYLRDSGGVFEGFFRFIVNNPQILQVVDFLNQWGLVAIGLGLIAGLFANIATICGILLLFLYYFSHPPFVGLEYAMPTEGSYLIVNKTLIEIAALYVLRLFPTTNVYGLDGLIDKKYKDKLNKSI